MQPLRTRVLRLDPAHPPLWRDDVTVQFGVDRRAEVSLDAPWRVRLLRELRTGIREDALELVAHAAGADPTQARAFLDAVSPVLQRIPLTVPTVRLEAADHDDSAAASWLAHALEAEGASVADADDPTAVMVRLVRGVAVARGFARALATDTVHLPVAFGPGGCTVGPLVVPGRTPCLSCRDGSRSDLDPAWPRVHAQIVGRSGGEITPARAVAAAPVVLALLTEPDPGFRSVRLDSDGNRRDEPISFHAECRCRDVWSRSLPGTSTASAHPAPKPAPTRSPASALTA